MFLDMTVKEFVDVVASDAPVPGGGSVSALVGGLSAALLEMVTSLSIGRKKYADVEEEMLKFRVEFHELQGKLLHLMEEDAKSYAVVMQAYSLPKDSEEEKTARTRAIQDGLYGAALVPLEVAKTCLQTLQNVEEVLLKGNKNAYSDVKVAGVMLRSALYGACYNVQINLESLKDSQRITFLEENIASLRKEADLLEKRIIDLEV